MKTLRSALKHRSQSHEPRRRIDFRSPEKAPEKRNTEVKNGVEHGEYSRSTPRGKQVVLERGRRSSSDGNSSDNDDEDNGGRDGRRRETSRREVDRSRRSRSSRSPHRPEAPTATNPPSSCSEVGGGRSVPQRTTAPLHLRCSGLTLNVAPSIIGGGTPTS